VLQVEAHREQYHVIWPFKNLIKERFIIFVREARASMESVHGICARNHLFPTLTKSLPYVGGGICPAGTLRLPSVGKHAASPPGRGREGLELS
jgi:hypothetical protein